MPSIRDPLDPARLRNHPILSRVIESGRTLPSGVTPSGALTPYAQNCAMLIRENREREKKEISDLNNRLARFIERVRFFEAQNRILESDIDLFKNAARIHTDRISIYIEAEKKSLQTLILENESKVNSAEITAKKLQPELAAAKKNFNEIFDHRQRLREQKKEDMKKLCELEADNALVKRLINDSEQEKAYIKAEISRLRGAIKKTNTLREKEKSDYHRTQQNIDELLKKINGSISQHEINVRNEINHARRDTTISNSEYFHKELQLSMKEVRERFDRETRAARSIWEEWYKKKVIEIKKNSENYSLRQNSYRNEELKIRSQLNELKAKVSDVETLNQQLIKRINELTYQEEEELKLFETSLTEKENAVQAMRDQCTKLTIELEQLCDNQINLNNEISSYRKLVETAENLNGKQFPSNFTIETPASVVRTTSYHSYGTAFNSHSTNTSQLNEKSSFNNDFSTELVTRTTTGGFIQIVEVAKYGTSATIENTDLVRSQDLSNWKLEHYVGQNLIGSYLFPVCTYIQPGEQLVINTRRSSLPSIHVAIEIDAFDQSSEGYIILRNDSNEIVASHYNNRHVRFI